jgi:predicted Fe-Mo cluster-binding NifX family protein
MEYGMKIAIPVQEERVESKVDSVFGRAPFFAVYDSKDKSSVFKPNPAKDAESGAGIQAFKMMVDLGVNAVITGEVGPKALDLLKSRGIRVVQPKRDTLKETLANLDELGLSG